MVEFQNTKLSLTNFVSVQGNQLDWLVSEINSLHLDFGTILPDRDSPLNDGQKTVLIEFTRNCIHLYGISRCHTKKLAKTDIFPGDEACMLAVKALMVLQRASTDSRCMIQVACLLDFVLADSEHNTVVKQMAVRIFKYTGLASLAFRAYKNLGVKGVLHETQATLFLTRMGSSYPRGPEEGGSPYAELGEGLKFYRDAESQLSSCQETAFSAQNYAQVLQFETLKSRLQNSPARRMMLFERRRIARLNGYQYEAFDSSIGKYSSCHTTPAQL